MGAISEWKDVECAPNYEICSDGRIHSKKRDILLKSFPDDWGYHRVGLYRDGKRIIRSVHRLVAETFIPNPLKKPQVNHIDGNRLNNRVENLEWATQSENQLHAFKTGLNDHSLYNAGKPKRKVILIETGQTFNSIHECADHLGCTHSAVIYCAQGKIQTCKGYHINYI